MRCVYMKCLKVVESIYEVFKVGLCIYDLFKVAESIY